MPDTVNISPNSKQSRAPSSANLGLIVLSLVIAVCFGLHLWTDRYSYEHNRMGVLVRINKFTGRTDMFLPVRGWVRR